LTAALEARDVSVRYGGDVALSNLSMSVDRGEILGIIGPNGAGKTTFLNVVSGLVKPHSGRVWIDGVDVSDQGVAARARSGLGRTFQAPRVSQQLTVEEQVALAVPGFTGAWRWRRGKSVGRRLAELLESVALLPKRTALCSQLTLGEVRRLETARALAASPRVLLIDEPSSGISAEEAQSLWQLIRNAAAAGVAVVLIEHNIPFVRSIVNRLIVLDAGSLLTQGEVNQVLSSPEVREAYLGRSAA